MLGRRGATSFDGLVSEGRRMGLSGRMGESGIMGEEVGLSKRVGTGGASSRRASPWPGVP